MNFRDELKKRVDEMNFYLEKHLNDIDADLAQYLMDAMRYSALGPGKRLRPILMAESARLFSESAEGLDEFMLAIECIHSYSLVHDDMPCIDNDEYRRKRKTTHALYGEATALLAGDGLLNLAYEFAHKAFNTGADPAVVGKALQVLSRKAGILGMVGGQAVDVDSEKNGTEINEEKLLFIHENKTGALIEAAMMVGAILAGANDMEVKKIERAASCIGIAFQIRDDILDVEGNFEELGKDIGSDAQNEKVTYVSLYGMERAKKDVEEYSKEAIEILASFKNRNIFLEDVVDELVNRKR